MEELSTSQKSCNSAEDMADSAYWSKQAPLSFKGDHLSEDMAESDRSKDAPLTFKGYPLRQNSPTTDCDTESCQSSSDSYQRKKKENKRKYEKTTEASTAKRKGLPAALKYILITAVVFGVAITAYYHVFVKELVVKHNLRIVMLGKVGAGKSATGNTLLGREAFKVDASPASVTTKCEKQTVVYGHTNLTVIDTPGVLDEMKVKVTECVDVLEPDVLLLVIRLGRFTEEEKNVVRWIKNSFGEHAPNYTMVLFTHLDTLKGKPLEEFLNSSRDLKALVSSVGGGYHAFDNEHGNSGQVEQLLKKMLALCYKTWGYTHTRKVHEKARAEEERKREETERLMKIEQQRRSHAEKQEQETKIKLQEELQRRISAEKEADNAWSRTLMIGFVSVVVMLCMMMGCMPKN